MCHKSRNRGTSGNARIHAEKARAGSGIAGSGKEEMRARTGVTELLVAGIKYGRVRNADKLGRLHQVSTNALSFHLTILGQQQQHQQQQHQQRNQQRPGAGAVAAKRARVAGCRGSNRLQCLQYSNSIKAKRSNTAAALCVARSAAVSTAAVSTAAVSTAAVSTAAVSTAAVSTAAVAAIGATPRWQQLGQLEQQQ